MMSGNPQSTSLLEMEVGKRMELLTKNACSSCKTPLVSCVARALISNGTFPSKTQVEGMPCMNYLCKQFCPARQLAETLNLNSTNGNCPVEEQLGIDDSSLTFSGKAINTAVIKAAPRFCTKL